MGEYIVLSDENGNDVCFDVIDYILYEDKKYIVLIESDPAAEEVVILESETSEDEEEEMFLEIEDEDVLQAVFDIFLKNKKKGAYKEIFY